MTDNEIITALKCCTESSDIADSYCLDCPRYRNGEKNVSICRKKLLIEVLETITQHRQKNEDAKKEELYCKTVLRLNRIGAKTQKEQILFLAEEIEAYRSKIRKLMEELAITERSIGE